MAIAVGKGRAVAGEWAPGVPERPAARLAAPAAPPVLTGGAKCQEEAPGSEGAVSVHWLQGTIPAERVEALLDYLLAMIGTPPELQEWGRYRYDCSASWAACGVVVYFDSSLARAKDVHAGRACLLFPGTACDGLAAAGLGQFLQDLAVRFWFRCTRIDVAWDDMARRITPAAIAGDVEQGNFTGFRVFEHRRPQRLGPGGAVAEGDTLSFGRRGRDGSGQYLRIYDKALESGGENPAIRWEVEFSGDRAATVFAGLAFVVDVAELGARLGALVGGAISFVDRSSGDGHLERLPLLAWWADILQVLGRVRVRAGRLKVSLERVRAWLEKQVSASLAVCREAYGGAWLGEVLATGERRMGDRHRDLLDQWRVCEGAS